MGYCSPMAQTLIYKIDLETYCVLQENVNFPLFDWEHFVYLYFASSICSGTVSRVVALFF